jgi:hypothetical protein
MELPNWNCYYRDGDANALRFNVGGFSFWYSYQTLIAFRVPGHPTVVSENYWTNTTGKHLNAIDGGKKNERVNEETFKRLLKDLVAPYFKNVA